MQADIRLTAERRSVYCKLHWPHESEINLLTVNDTYAYHKCDAGPSRQYVTYERKENTPKVRYQKTFEMLVYHFFINIFKYSCISLQV